MRVTNRTAILSAKELQRAKEIEALLQKGLDPVGMQIVTSSCSYIISVQEYMAYLASISKDFFITVSSVGKQKRRK